MKKGKHTKKTKNTRKKLIITLLCICFIAFILFMAYYFWQCYEKTKSTSVSNTENVVSLSEQVSEKKYIIGADNFEIIDVNLTHYEKVFVIDISLKNNSDKQQGDFEVTFSIFNEKGDLISNFKSKVKPTPANSESTMSIMSSGDLPQITNYSIEKIN